MADDMVNELRGTKKSGFTSGKLILILAIFVFLLAVTSGFYIFYSIDNTIPLNAHITNFRGSVQVQKDGEDAPVSAEENMLLKENDRVITGSDGLVEIVFEDGSHTRLGADTQMSISKLHTLENGGSRIIELDVPIGMLWTKVAEIEDSNSLFDVNTPTAVAGVRGTEFFTRVLESNESLIRVYEGLVSVSSKTDIDEEGDAETEGQFMVSSLQQVSFAPGIPQPFESSPVDFKDVEEFEKDNLVEDNPVMYLDVEYTVMTILISEKKDEISDIDSIIEELQEDAGFVDSVLRNESDEARKSDLEKIYEYINNLIEEQESIIELVEEEIEEYEEIKEIIDVIKQAIEENFQDLSREELIDRIRREARNIRLTYKEGGEDRAARKLEKEEKKAAVMEGFERIGSLSSALGIAEELLSVTDFEEPERDEEDPPTDADDDEEVEDVTEEEKDDEVEDEPKEEREEEREERVVDEKVGEPVKRDPPEEKVSPEKPVKTNYNVSLSANLVTAGKVSGGGSFAEGSNVKISAEPQNGFRFVKWVSYGEDISTDKTYSFILSGNRNFKAIFTPNVHLVEFRNFNDDTIKVDVVNYKGDAIAPELPLRIGYVFKGWDKDFTNVTRNLTVSPLYEERTYEVRFLDFDDSVIKTEEVLHGWKATAPPDPERSGYVFKGWDKDFSYVSDDMTVRAVYEGTAFVVRFLDNDGNVLKKEVVEAGGSATPPEAPSVNGYIFYGWDGDDYTDVSSDVTVKPIYVGSSSLSGTFVDADDDSKVKVIEGVAVELIWQYEIEDGDSVHTIEKSLNSDSNGSFSFENLPSGDVNKYHLSFSHEDYEKDPIEAEFTGSSNLGFLEMYSRADEGDLESEEDIQKDENQDSSEGKDDEIEGENSQEEDDLTTEEDAEKVISNDSDESIGDSVKDKEESEYIDVCEYESSDSEECDLRDNSGETVKENDTEVLELDTEIEADSFTKGEKISDNADEGILTGDNVSKYDIIEVYDNCCSASAEI